MAWKGEPKISRKKLKKVLKICWQNIVCCAKIKTVHGEQVEEQKSTLKSKQYPLRNNQAVVFIKYYQNKVIQESKAQSWKNNYKN